MLPTRRATTRAYNLSPISMAWRPNECLIDGELDNRTPGKVTGWMRFFRRRRKPLKVTLDLEGDFHEDIRGKEIVLNNPEPRDRIIDATATYMDGFARVQRGTGGDMTAGLPLGPWTEGLAAKLKAQLALMLRESGSSDEEIESRLCDVDKEYREKIAAGELYRCYVDYPYLEWYADNGRVVLELDPSQVTVIGQEAAPTKEKSAEELVRDRKKRVEAFGHFMHAVVSAIAEQNRKAGGDGNVAGMVI